MADEGRREGEMLTMADKGGEGGLDPLFLADIICEQPLICDIYLLLKKIFHTFLT